MHQLELLHFFVYKAVLSRKDQHALDMIEQLPVTVGFELEFELDARNLSRLARAMEYAGHSVDCAARWRHTPPEVSGGGRWDIKTDSSCGYEAVSPVIRTYSELKRCASVAKIVAECGGKATAKCGFHVHVGLRDLPPKHYGRLFSLLTRYQAAFFLLVSPNRRLNSYCKPLEDRTVNAIRQLATRAASYESPTPSQMLRLGASFDAEWADKNVWLNGKTFNRIGTLEFRLMEGTLDPEHIEGYILFLMQLFSQIISGKKVSWGTANARDERMLFYTMLQQLGCYGKTALDPDLAKLARTWAIGAFRKSGKSSRRTRASREELPDDVDATRLYVDAAASTPVFTASTSSSSIFWNGTNTVTTNT